MNLLYIYSPFLCTTYYIYLSKLSHTYVYEILLIKYIRYYFKNPNKFGQKSRQLVIKYLYVRYSIRLQKRLFQSF